MKIDDYDLYDFNIVPGFHRYNIVGRMKNTEKGLYNVAETKYIEVAEMFCNALNNLENEKSRF